MTYASSKDNLKKKLEGIQVECQCSDDSELDFEEGMLLLLLLILAIGLMSNVRYPSAQEMQEIKPLNVQVHSSTVP